MSLHFSSRSFSTALALKSEYYQNDGLYTINNHVIVNVSCKTCLSCRLSLVSQCKCNHAIWWRQHFSPFSEHFCPAVSITFWGHENRPGMENTESLHPSVTDNEQGSSVSP